MKDYFDFCIEIGFNGDNSFKSIINIKEIIIIYSKLMVVEVERSG